MPTTSIRSARRDASNICTKTECNIVNLSSPNEVKNLSEAQLKRQIKLSRKLFHKHRDNYKRLAATAKKTPHGADRKHNVQIKMSLMEDSQHRFEKALKQFKAKAAAKSAVKTAGRKKRTWAAHARTAAPRSAKIREARMNA